MTAGQTTRAYIYQMLVDEYANTNTDVYFGFNLEREGFSYVEIFGIDWDETDYASGGNQGRSSQTETFRVNGAITCRSQDTSLLEVVNEVWSIYNTIDGLVKDDPSFGGLVFIMSQVTPVSEKAVIEGNQFGAQIFFDVVCKNYIDNVA